MSLGGHASLTSAALHDRYGPELDIRAFAAAAPARGYAEQWRSGVQVSGEHLALHAMLAWSFAGGSIAPGSINLVLQPNKGRTRSWARAQPSQASASSASTSARSFVRRVARLFFSSSARPRNASASPSTVSTRRPAYASSKSTPTFFVRMSIRRGGRPIW